jgi:small subunit ribosomal protein S4
MGHPKFSRKKYDSPTHPWKSARIKEEHAIKANHGLKNVREIWKANSALRRHRHQAMKLISRAASPEPHLMREYDDLLRSLYNKGLIPDGATLDNILELSVEDMLGRRLQTLVRLKGLAVSHKQARQLITHGHISIGEQKVTIPAYPVSREEEENITYVSRSVLSNPNHSIRQDIETLRSTAEYGEEEPVEMGEVFVKSDAEVIAERAAAAPSSESTMVAEPAIETAAEPTPDQPEGGDQ